MEHLVSGRMLAGENTHMRSGRTARCGVVIPQDKTILGERVYIWSQPIRIAVASEHIAPGAIEN